MASSIGKLALLISADSSPFSKELEKASRQMDGFGDRVRKSYQRTSEEISRIKLEATPFNVRKSVALGLAKEQATGELTRARGIERLRQMTGGTVGGTLKGLLGGDRGNILSSLRDAGGGSALKGISAAFSGAGGAAGALGKVAGALGAVAGPAAVAAAAIIGVPVALKKAGDMIAGFVSKSNPALAERYFRVFEDMQAVIGSRLAPLLELFTDGWRLVADVLHTLLPSQKEFAEMLAPLKAAFGEYREYIGNIAAALKPLIMVAFKQLAIYIAAGAKALETFYQAMNRIVDLARSIPGATAILGEGGQSNLRSSFGMAVTQAQYVNNAEDLSRNAIIKAFEQQGGGGPAEETARNTERTAAAAERTAAALDMLTIAATPSAGLTRMIVRRLL